MLRYVRIAFSILCVIACLLLVALWVRTIYAVDSVTAPFSKNAFLLATSRQGGLSLAVEKGGTSSWERFAFPPDSLPHFQYSGALGFGIYWSDAEHIYAVRFPYWASILITGAIPAATLTGARPRFSLRTLLIAMTLVAVVLGLVVWSRH